MALVLLREVQHAPELLAPVYGWFMEGFNMRDLKEAKALLGQLGRRVSLRRALWLLPIFSAARMMARWIRA